MSRESSRSARWCARRPGKGAVEYEATAADSTGACRRSFRQYGNRATLKGAFLRTGSCRRYARGRIVRYLSRRANGFCETVLLWAMERADWWLAMAPRRTEEKPPYRDRAGIAETEAPAPRRESPRHEQESTGTQLYPVGLGARWLSIVCRRISQSVRPGFCPTRQARASCPMWRCRLRLLIFEHADTYSRLPFSAARPARLCPLAAAPCPPPLISASQLQFCFRHCCPSLVLLECRMRDQPLPGTCVLPGYVETWYYYRRLHRILPMLFRRNWRGRIAVDKPSLCRWVGGICRAWSLRTTGCRRGSSGGRLKPLRVRARWLRRSIC